VHDDPRDDFLLLPPVRRSLRRLAERGIPFDVPDAWPRHLAATADLAAALPDLRIVVDHLGKPPFGGAGWERWRATLGEVAAHPNTTAKASGLQVPGRPFTVAEARPAWEVALELFGPARLMWGSDWPLTVLVGGYAHAWEVMSTLVAELSADEQALVLSGTATEVYRL
jgi:L-fuconolactonase